KRREVIELTKRNDIWLILISRSTVPAWLRDAYIERNFILISEEDLGLTCDDISEYLRHEHFEVSEGEVKTIVESSEGNGYLVKYALVETLNGHSLNKEQVEKIRDSYISSLTEKVLLWLEPEVKELLMKLSLVESFDIELAKVLAGDKNVGRIIERALESGNFMRKNGESYTFRKPMQKALYDELQRCCSHEQIDGFIRNIALYFEMDGNEIKALEFYAKCNDTDKIRDMLVRNAKMNPEMGYFYEMRKYYLMLSEHDIESEPWLMISMSLLYSVLMNIEKSEFWYGRLKERLAGAKGSEKREIQVGLAYLDIALPHRGSVNTLETIKNQYVLMREKSSSFPELSVTSNIPSMLNGGKDFCEWTKKDKELLLTTGKVLSTFLGSHGKGFVSLGLAESFYEKGGDSYEISNLISKAKNQIEAGSGNYNMMFVAIGLQARLFLINGEISEARELVEGFRERTEKTKLIFKLGKNIDALLCRISLYEGDFGAINDWLSNKAPDENEFFVLNRYQYITKIRCYIAVERYAPALALIDRMSDYAEICDRKYISMELAVLKSIIKFRKKSAWQEEFTAALRKIKEYDFIRIVTEHGAAVYPLLDAVREEFLSDEDTAEWFGEMLDEARKIALRYPVYLKTEIANLPALSETAVNILKMQAEGMTLKQIGERLGITERTAKFHAQETYRKLGVNSRTEAILAAKNLNII
ncbi:MAG: LuxR C-terminal-related transcriptional regulator, partial [Oscillospiraceae bacterium]